MKSKKGFLLIVLAFVLLLVGAGALYRYLGQQVETEQLAVQEQSEAVNTEDQTKEETDTEDAKPEDTDAEVSDTHETQQLTKAPDFTVYDADGNAVHLTDYFGKPIVLNFWASWCGPCKMEMPDFHEKYLDIGEDVHFLMVNMTTGRETVETAQAFIEEQGYTFPVFFDTESSAAITYGVYSLPTTYFIDADGYAIAQASGAIDAATLQRGLDMIC